ncbi:MAG: BlaI/MecI/CopY family transcriptional regulator [Acidobacteriota bacterium]
MESLSRRERQILDILYARGKATAADIQAALPDSPSYSTTRALLRILEEKGHARHEEDGTRYVYLPKVSRQKARVTALRHMLQTFFDGSAVDAAAALVDGSAANMSAEELSQLEALIERARAKSDSQNPGPNPKEK